MSRRDFDRSTNNSVPTWFLLVLALILAMTITGLVLEVLP
jgi:hypothetical protein